MVSFSSVSCHEEPAHLDSNSILQRFRFARQNTLVQTDPPRVLRVDLRIEGSLEVTVGTQALLDETTAAPTGPQLQSLEPVDVLGVEEHVSNRHDLLVDLVRVASEDGTLRNHTAVVWSHNGSGTDQIQLIQRQQ